MTARGGVDRSVRVLDKTFTLYGGAQRTSALLIRVWGDIFGGVDLKHLAFTVLNSVR